MSELKRMIRLTWGQAQIEANFLKDAAYPLVKQGLAASEIKRRLSQDTPVEMSDRAFRTFIGVLKGEWDRELTGSIGKIISVNNCKGAPLDAPQSAFLPPKATPSPKSGPARVVADSINPSIVAEISDTEPGNAAASDEIASTPKNGPGGFKFNPNPDPKKIFGEDK
ncbi:hypothetical protein [Pseudovibrio sp. Tun.PSC04-5.I4]|uniref:hypothetical protein n=1 Tax=Pseudovibrio sp. Tun.PSC04-5.I4 TaxID=1798213 RepID=UPI000883BC73|nr:hypothetical protein [Pseudovibrio sp. Tun.PSC04-5.I4]SDR49083.1 hypothetical protein SAMN04515695_6120 [Pseudovibrio sp. Tun.PSC04-5.I4]